MTSLLIINGPNLNMLGRREPDIYGTQTLEDIRQDCEKKAGQYGFKLDFRQSNHEGEIVEWIQQSLDSADAVIINAAAYTHSSVAIHDALKLLTVPVIEVHLSDPLERESFRHHSYIAPVAEKVISGQGADGYGQAIDYIADRINMKTC